MATDSPHNEIGSSHRTVDASLDRSKGESVIVNASGHVQEVERNFSLISTCAVGLTVGNVWPGTSQIIGYKLRKPLKYADSRLLAVGGAIVSFQFEVKH